MHISEVPPEKMIRMDGDAPHTLYSGKDLGKSATDKIWANAGGLDKAIDFMQSHYWKNRGMPPHFWVHFFVASNPYYKFFYQHFGGNRIMFGNGNPQWYVKSNVKVVSSGVFKYVKEGSRLERIW